MPEEDQGYILVNAPLPDASSLERTDAVMQKVEKVLAANEGVKGYNTISGFSLITGAYSTNMGFFFVELKPWEERHTRGAARQRRGRGAEPGVRARQIPEGRRRGVRSAGHPGPRHRRRVHDGAAGPRRAHARVAGRPGRALHGGGQEAPGDRPHRDALPRQRAAGLRRHRPQQGAEGRRADRRREHDARLPARQRLRERLQPVRPRLQGVRAGRARVPDATRSSSACSSCAARTARWCRSTRW